MLGMLPRGTLAGVHDVVRSHAGTMHADVCCMHILTYADVCCMHMLTYVRLYAGTMHADAVVPDRYADVCRMLTYAVC
jgi:hypothetical protein